MDSSDDDPFHLSPLSSSSTTKEEDEEDEKVENNNNNNNVEDLLEEAWFFGKVLSTTKPTKTMCRCFSDPSPNFGEKKNIVEEKAITSKLNRQLSDLSLVKKESRFPRQKVITTTGRPSSKHNKLLLRTPSLPSPSIAALREEEEEDDCDITMSRLIREAMPLSSSQVLPPRSHSSKGMTKSYSLQKNRSARNLKDLGYPNQRDLKEIPSVVVESKQVEGGFKDLGFTFNQKQDKADEDYKVKRSMPYWYAKSCAPPPIPIWAKKNSSEDMKLQLKYWARAVASKAR